MQATGVAQLQNVAPNTPCTVSPVAGHETLEHFGTQYLIVLTTLTLRPGELGIETTAGHTERRT